MADYRCDCGNQRSFHASRCWECHLASKRARMNARPECRVVGCHVQASADHGFCHSHEARTKWPEWKQSQPQRATVEYVLWKFKDHPKPIEVVSTTGRMKDPTTFNNPECDHPEWVVAASSVASDGSGCPECHPTTKTTDLGEFHQVMIDVDWEPVGRYPNAIDGWMCLCLNCKQIGYPSLSNARAGKRHDCHQFRYELADVVEAMDLFGFDVVDDSEFQSSQSWMRFRHRECGTITKRKPHRYLISDSDYHHPPSCARCRNPWGMSWITLAAMIRRKGYRPVTNVVGVQSVSERITVLHLECNTERTVKLSNLLYRDTSGCAHCANGFSPSKDSVVYLIWVSDYDVKVGITNLDPDCDPRDNSLWRVAKLERSLPGKLAKFWRFDSGHDAAEVEASVKSYFATHRPQDPRDGDGFTERIKGIFFQDVIDVVDALAQPQPQLKLAV